MSQPPKLRYLDANATTPVDPRVLADMLPYFTEHFGNAESAQHAYGWKAKSAVDKARLQTGALINAHPSELIFTSGSTESMSLAILGFLEAQPAGRHLISTNAEHKATLESLARAKKHGHEVTLLPVNKFGQVTPEQIANAIQPNTALVTLMHANNEVGSLNPIEAIGRITRDRNVTFHVDAAQTVGKQPVDVKAMKIDLLSISAHKFYGPKGVGALYVRRHKADERDPVHIAPLMLGGGQEKGLRGGTHNVTGIVGLGKACEIAMLEMATEGPRLQAMRDKIIAAVVRPETGIELNGHPTERLCMNIHLTLNGVGTDQLMRGLRDFAFSTASACSAGAASYVLKAMDRAPSETGATNARFGLSRYTTDEDVELLIQKLLELSPMLSASYDSSRTRA